ncbi:MAG: CC0125/CC1285 family lipoprotein, partial [Planctomycetota bacterium]
MNKLIISATLVLITGLFGCRATPYQRLGTTSAGGYSEKAMSEDTFYVKFSANNHTSSKIVCRYLYRRAAEVTLRHGFLFFTVIRGPSPLTDRVSFYSSEDSYNDMAAPIEIDVPQSN